MARVNELSHRTFSYHAFAAGANAFGMAVALRCCVTYGVPLATALQYRRRYAGAYVQSPL